MMSHDVIVVGGGLIGMLTARYLQMQGFNVALVEKNRLGGEASWAAGGILSKLYPWQQNDEVQKLVALGQLAFPSLVSELYEETEIDAQLLRSGMLIVDVDEQQVALEWSYKNKTSIELIGQKEINRLEPNIEKNISSALYVPTTMQVRPPLLLKAVHQSLINHNVHIFEGITANNLVLQSNKVIGIETKSNTMFAEHVVICNGAWVQQLLKKSSNLIADVEPVRGQMLLFKTQQTLLTHILVKDGFYLIPRKDQYVLSGSTVEHVGFSKATTCEAKEILSRQAYKLSPDLKDEEIVKYWSALRPGTTRDVPYICAHPEIEGLYINAGHFRYGIVMSIPTAKMAADLVANKANASQISAYAW